MDLKPSSMLHDPGMTDKPEYPFRYIGVLKEEFRPQALEDVAWCREQVDKACVALVPRATKEEFLAWAASIWDEALDSYSDYLSSRHE